MVDAETIGKKIDEKAEKVEEKIDEKKEEQKEKFEERKEKGKNTADNLMTEIQKNMADFKEGIKNLQKTADAKYNEYKQTTSQTLDTEFLETKDTYYIKLAVPGIEKEDVILEATDNNITLETTFKPFIDEFEDDETAEVISSTLKKGKCVKTIRFENSIDLENITAKFNNGTVVITLPKLIIPKHKINVE